MRKLTVLVMLAASIYCAVNPAKPVMANGWGHGAIPFADLLRALSFDDTTTRARAARSLGLRGQAEAVAPLIAMLGSESMLAVRIEIYSALGKLGSPAALSALLDCLDGQEQETARSACTTALANVGGERAMSRLIQALDDESFLVRSMAVEGLGRFPSVLAVESLEVVYRRGNRSLKRRALHALGMTGIVQSAPLLLEALQQAESDDIRLMVVKGLGNSGASEAVAPLQRLQGKTDNPVLRTAVVIALGSITSQDRLSALTSFLQDQLPAVRFVALQALRELNDPRSAAAIIQRATSNADALAELSHEAMRAQPLQALGLISEQVLALEILTDLAPQASASLFLSAAAKIPIDIESGSDASLAAAVFRLRRTALYGMGYSQSASAWKFLAGKGGIGSSNFRLQATSVRSLGVLDKPLTTPLIIPFLKHDIAEVRWNAASVLGRIGGNGAVEALMASLEDPQAEVRRQAALGLGYQKAAPARSALLQLAKAESDTQVGQAARFALSLIDN
jgi:HEAT repeat protein